MSDEKNFNNENEEVNEEIVEETAEAAETEEVAEESAEISETETAEDAQEAVSEAVEEAEATFVAEESAESVLGENTSFVEAAESGSGDDEENSEAVAVEAVEASAEKNPVSKGAVVGIIAAAVLVVALVVLGIIYAPSIFNKYNRQGYTDISGRTVEEVAEEAGMSLEEFLEYYGLPEDMPGNTTEAAAYNNIPCGNMAKTYGLDFDTMKELLKLPEDATEDTPWGEALAKVTLGSYVGEDNLDSFKETYGFGDEVTADTLWGDVRQTVEAKQKKEFEEEQKAAAEAEKAAEQNNDEAEVTDDANTEATAAPAE